MKEIFDLQNYYFNPWAIPMLFTGLMTLLEGFTVFIKNPKGLTNKMYGLWLTFVTFWMFGMGIFYFSRSSEVSVFWYKSLTFAGVAFISYGSYLFSLSFIVSNFRKHKGRIIFFGSIFVGFYFAGLFSNFIIRGTYSYFWGLYPKYNTGGAIFLAFWIFLYLLTVSNLIKAYKEAILAKKKQMKLMLIGTIIVYSGAVDYLPAFGVEIYPFGYLSVIFYFSLIAYIIIRYRALEIETVIHRTILWILSSSLIFISIGTLLFFTRKFLAGLSWFQLSVFTTILFYLFLFYYQKVQPKIDHFFRRRKYDYQTILGKIAEKLATIIDMNELAKEFVTEICETMYLQNSLFYIMDKENSRYILLARRGYRKYEDRDKHLRLEIFDEKVRMKLPKSFSELRFNNSLCGWIGTYKKIVEKNQLGIDPEYEQIREKALDWFEELNSELIVPLVFENEVPAFLVLGKKESLQPYTLKDIQLLTKLGREIGVTVFNALHYKDLIEKERMGHELQIGKEIQMALLPQSSPDMKGLKVNGLMHPAREIGGDYYDYINMSKNGDYAIVIGDVSGKGVGAGLIMATVKASLKLISEQNYSPKKVLEKLNHILYEFTADDRYMTFLYFLWQSGKKVLTYASAGHEHILKYNSKTDHIDSIMSGGRILGAFEKISNDIEEKRISLGAKDKILLFTDGVTEARNAKGDLFDLEGLEKAFYKHRKKSEKVLLSSIKKEVYSFMGSTPQRDDITLVVMEVK
ncbi:MAG: SpoIIE family protein phosphatase [Spirochaetes bacterium]|nr:SpoIIE family protein phosphatase [Spirochaetota bacterium]